MLQLVDDLLNQVREGHGVVCQGRRGNAQLRQGARDHHRGLQDAHLFLAGHLVGRGVGGRRLPGLHAVAGHELARTRAHAAQRKLGGGLGHRVRGLLGAHELVEHGGRGKQAVAAPVAVDVPGAPTWQAGHIVHKKVNQTLGRPPAHVAQRHELALLAIDLGGPGLGQLFEHRDLAQVGRKDAAGVDVGEVLLHAGAHGQAAGGQLGRQLCPGAIGVAHGHSDAPRANAGQVTGLGGNELHLGHGACGLQELNGAGGDYRLSGVEQGGEKLVDLGVAGGGGGLAGRGVADCALPHHKLDAGALGVGAQQGQARAGCLARRAVCDLQAHLDVAGRGHTHHKLALGTGKGQVAAGHQADLLSLNSRQNTWQAVVNLRGLNVALAVQKAAVGARHANGRDLGLA